MHGSANRASSFVRAPHWVQLVNQAEPLSAARGRSLPARLLGHASTGPGARPVRGRHVRRCAGCGPGCSGRVGSTAAGTAAAGSARVSRPGAGAQRVGSRGFGSRGVVSGGLAIGERRGAGSSGAPERAPDGLGLTFEGVGVLLAAAEIASLALELVHGHGGQLGGGVVLWLVLVDLMDRDGGMNHGRLDGLLLDNWLNDLVHMMVDVLTGNGRTGDRGVLHVVDVSGILELCTLGHKPLLHKIRVAMLVRALLQWNHTVNVLLREDFSLLDGLDRGVIVILMHLSVNCRLRLITFSADNFLVFHGGFDNLHPRSAWFEERERRGSHLVHGGVVFSIPGKEAIDC